MLLQANADDFELSDAYVAQNAVAGTAGWDDTAMDAYDDYDTHKPQL